MRASQIRFFGGAALVAAALVAALLWRGGGPHAMAAPPANDNFAGATNAASLPFSGAAETAEATEELNEDQTCAGIDKTVWFSYTATSDGLLVADTAGSGFDTALAAYGYAFESPPLGLFQVGCNNDGAGIGPASELELDVHAGQQVFFQVGGAAGASGSLSFNLEFRPRNDDFSDATFIFEVPFTETVPTAGATDEVGETQPCGGIAKTVWYSVFAPGNFTITISTAGSDFDTVLAAYSYGPSSPPLALQTLACNDDVSGGDQTSSIEFQVQEGVEYLIQAGGKNGASGNLAFTLTGPPPGSISGTVRDDNGNPVAGADVFADAYSSCCTNASATTDASGFYRIEGLLPINYRLFAAVEGYVAEYYDNTYDFGAAQAVPVFSGAETTGIDFALGIGGGIAGTVVAQADGTPIAGAFVYAQTDNWCCGFAETEANGAFSIATLPPGEYWVYTFADGYASEIYDDTNDFNQATLVTVVDNMTTSGIVIDLQAEAQIAGVVTDANGTPIEGASVFADSNFCCASGDAITESDGSYVIGGLPEGFYRVSAQADGFVGEYYDNTYEFFDATLVDAPSGTTTSGIDFQLGEPASISGTVTDEGGTPIAGAIVEAESATTFEDFVTETAADGTYVITGLPPDSYRVLALSPDHVGEYYLNATSENDATPVVTISGTDTPGIDFTLAAYSVIEGTVTNDVGSPLEDVYVQAQETPCCGFGYDYTDSDGRYRIILPEPGDYLVYAQGYGAIEWYDNVLTSDDATLVAVAQSQTTENIDFQLDVPPTPTPSPTATYPPGVDTPTPTPTYTPITQPGTPTPATPPGGGVYTHTPTSTPTPSSGTDTATPTPSGGDGTATPTPADTETPSGATETPEPPTNTPTATATSGAQTATATSTSQPGDSTATPASTNTPQPTQSPPPTSTYTSTPTSTTTPGGGVGPPDTSTPTGTATATATATSVSSSSGGGRSEGGARSTATAPQATATSVATPVVSVLPATAIPPTPRVGTAPIAAPDTGSGSESDRGATALLFALAAAGALAAAAGVAIRGRR